MASPTVHVHHDRSGVAIVALHGEHDLATLPEFEQALDRALARDRAIVVDLTDATFIDSSVVGAIIRLHNDRGHTAIVAPSGSFAARVLDLLGIHTLIPIRDTLSAALATLASRSDT